MRIKIILGCIILGVISSACANTNGQVYEQQMLQEAESVQDNMQQQGTNNVQDLQEEIADMSLQKGEDLQEEPADMSLQKGEDLHDETEDHEDQNLQKSGDVQDETVWYEKYSKHIWYDMDQYYFMIIDYYENQSHWTQQLFTNGCHDTLQARYPSAEITIYGLQKDDLGILVADTLPYKGEGDSYIWNIENEE